MRKKNSLYNSFAAAINRTITIVFMFLVRAIFTHNLNSDYLGLEGLFANILGLFSLVDLGIGSAISFNLYEPLHESDDEKLCGIMHLYKKIYIIIGSTILFLSLCFMSVIPFFIKDSEITNSYIRQSFIIYALGVSITYFFAYKRTLIFAMQKNYIVLNVDSIVKVVLSVCQILTLTIYKNYLIYLSLTVIFNLLGNIIISLILDKRHVYDSKKKGVLEPTFVAKLKEDVRALAVTNIAWQSLVSSDNIIISLIIGLGELAKNANYSTISASVNSVFAAVLGGASAAIGDLLVEKDNNRSRDYFNRYSFIHVIIGAYTALGIIYISRPFIILWVGEKYVFSDLIVFVIALNVFLNLLFRPLGEYQNYSGLFVRFRPYSIFAVLLNVIISVLIGKQIGILGVFLGTSVTYLFLIVSVLRILNQYLFNNLYKEYFTKTIIEILPAIISYILIKQVLPFVNIYGVLGIIKAVCIVTAIYFITVIIVLCRNDEYIYFKKLVVDIIKKKL